MVLQVEAAHWILVFRMGVRAGKYCILYRWLDQRLRVERDKSQLPCEGSSHPPSVAHDIVPLEEDSACVVDEW